LAAQKIAPAPSLTYNIGLVYERMGRLAEAATAFEKYLTELPAPSTKDERQFRDNLNQRARSARERAASGVATPPQPPPPTQQQPPRQPPPPTVNGQPNPPPPNQPYYYPQQQQQPYYGYQPYAPYGGYAYPPMMFQKTPQQKLEDARARHGRAIGLLVTGTVLNAIGIGLLGWGLIGVNGDNKNVASGGLDFLGGSLFLVGVTLWAPGAASFVKSSRDIAEAQKQLQQPAPTPPGPPRAPTTFLFSAPTFTF
jgi:hypothetical protein